VTAGDDFGDVELAAIVAVAENGVIGRDNALPWHLPEDLRYFKRVTMGKPILMGRKTWESIGRALPGRTSIVISRDPAYRAEGAIVVTTLDEAMTRGVGIARSDGVRELLVIGGAAIYAEALPRLRRLYLTRVHAAPQGDAFLPPLDLDQWREVSREFHAACATNPYDYSFIVYERR
jgi:dihydrofolate reductase